MQLSFSVGVLFILQIACVLLDYTIRIFSNAKKTDNQRLPSGATIKPSPCCRDIVGSDADDATEICGPAPSEQQLAVLSGWEG